LVGCPARAVIFLSTAADGHRVTVSRFYCGNCTATPELALSRQKLAGLYNNLSIIAHRTISVTLLTRAGNGSMGHGSMGQMGHCWGWSHGSWVGACWPV